MLRQSLKTLGVDTKSLLEQAGIDPTARAEEIPVDGFVTMANIFAGQIHNRVHVAGKDRGA
jgi:16S rRNA (adenine1518-N6/adenine1519-N6)-dimethyltransferase